MHFQIVKSQATQEEKKYIHQYKKGKGRQIITKATANDADKSIPKLH